MSSDDNVTVRKMLPKMVDFNPPSPRSDSSDVLDPELSVEPPTAAKFMIGPVHTKSWNFKDKMGNQCKLTRANVFYNCATPTFADPTLDEDVDETDLDPKEIEIVMTRARCPRAFAVNVIRALLQHRNKFKSVEEETEDVDETDLDPDEIDTVMNQADCNRAQAVKALKKHRNMVDAILDLTP